VAGIDTGMGRMATAGTVGNPGHSPGGCPGALMVDCRRASYVAQWRTLTWALSSTQSLFKAHVSKG
jgi:hypothetical protein